MIFNRVSFEALLYLHYTKDRFEDERFKEVYEALVEGLAKWHYYTSTFRCDCNIEEKDRKIVRNFLTLYLSSMDKRKLCGFRKHVFVIIDRIDRGEDAFFRVDADCGESVEDSLKYHNVVKRGLEEARLIYEAFSSIEKSKSAEEKTK